MAETVKLNVLYEDNHVLCVEKPVNMPVMEDDSKDTDLLSLCKAYLKEKYNKPGNVYCGLVHRLDRPVGGVMVFAKTSKAASRLSDSVRKHELQKVYTAVVHGALPQSNTLKDYLKKDHKTNMVSVSNQKDKDAKYAELSYTTLKQIREKNETLSLVEVHLKTGRPHQIRVQFASRGWPLVYDQRYGIDKKKGQIALFASSLTFPHPTLKEDITVSLPLPERDPYTIFTNERQ